MEPGPGPGDPVRLRGRTRGVDPGAADGRRRRARCGAAAAHHGHPERAGGTEPAGGGAQRPHLQPAEDTEGRRHPDRPGRGHHVPGPGRPRAPAGGGGPEGSAATRGLGVPGGRRDGRLPRTQGAAHLRRREAAARAAALPDLGHHRRAGPRRLAGTRVLRGRQGARGAAGGPGQRRPDRQLRQRRPGGVRPLGPGAAPAGPGRLRRPADAGRGVHRRGRAVRR